MSSLQAKFCGAEDADESVPQRQVKAAKANCERPQGDEETPSGNALTATHD